MNEKARKYVDMFREVKVASAATVDKERHPHSLIINIMIASDEGMYIVTFLRTADPKRRDCAERDVSGLPVSEVYGQSEAGR